MDVDSNQHNPQAVHCNCTVYVNIHEERLGNIFREL